MDFVLLLVAFHLTCYQTAVAQSTRPKHTPYRFVLEIAINGRSEQYKPFLLIMIAVRSSADWLTGLAAGWAGHFFIILLALVSGSYADCVVMPFVHLMPM